MHIVLLGDSIFDNKAYTEGGPDVVAHLRDLLIPSDRATLLAIDGDMTVNVYDQLVQLRRLTANTSAASAAGDTEVSEPPTHLVLSVGGNDLLNEIDVLSAPASSVGEGLLAVSEVSRRFAEEYRALLAEVLAFRLPTVICAVYNGAFEDPAEAQIVETALRVFDHEIVEAGLDHDLPVVDLRRVCDDPADYWNPIEPSDRGGAKIAAAVLGALRAPRYDLAGPPVTVQGTGGLSA